MPITSPSPFLAAYLDYDTCELFLNEHGTITAYVPTRDRWQAQYTIETASYVSAELICRAMGITPTWN